MHNAETMYAITFGLTPRSYDIKKSRIHALVRVFSIINIVLLYFLITLIIFNDFEALYRVV